MQATADAVGRNRLRRRLAACWTPRAPVVTGPLRQQVVSLEHLPTFAIVIHLHPNSALVFVHPTLSTTVISCCLCFSSLAQHEPRLPAEGGLIVLDASPN